MKSFSLFFIAIAKLCFVKLPNEVELGKTKREK